MVRESPRRPTLRRRARHSSIRSVDVDPPELDVPQEDPAEGTGATSIDATERLERIARAAYYRGEKRGFSQGFEVDDWLEAEREVDAAPSDPAP